jgi:hypothetical protein
MTGLPVISQVMPMSACPNQAWNAVASGVRLRASCF